MPLLWSTHHQVSRGPAPAAATHELQFNLPLHETFADMPKRQREEDAESKHPKKKAQKSDTVPLKAFIKETICAIVRAGG